MELISMALQQSGRALQYMALELQSNREVVSIAIRQSAGALKYASEELRGDKDIVSLAVQKDPNALEFATAELLADAQFIPGIVKEKGARMAVPVLVDIARLQPSLLSQLPREKTHEAYFGTLKWEFEMISESPPVLEKVSSLLASGSRSEALRELERVKIYLNLFKIYLKFI